MNFYEAGTAGVLACEFAGRLAPSTNGRRDAARTRRRGRRRRQQTAIQRPLTPPKLHVPSVHRTSCSNPNGVASSSPGLRGTSYPGWHSRESSTPTGLRHRSQPERGRPARKSPAMRSAASNRAAPRTPAAAEWRSPTTSRCARFKRPADFFSPFLCLHSFANSAFSGKRPRAISTRLLHAGWVMPQPRWGCGLAERFPRVARSSQPWAGGRNPVGILRGAF